MKYIVLWAAAAEQQLARLWIETLDREAVRAAADDLDHHLARHPLDMGESREGSLRVAFHHPLGISYDVFEEKRLVFVWSVWRIDRSSH